MQSSQGLDPAELTPFIPEGILSDYQNVSLKNGWTGALGVFISVSVGIYAGLMCRSMQDSWIYASLFSFEALISAGITMFVKSYGIRRATKLFVMYFMLTAISTPIAAWFSFRFLD